MQGLTIRTTIALALLALLCSCACADGSLELVGQFGGLTNGFAVSGDYAYLGVGMRLTCVDITDPLHPVQVGQSGVLPYRVNEVAAVGETVYVAGNSPDLQLIDVSDPAHPAPVGTLAVGSSAYMLRVHDGYLYAFTSGNGMRVINISNPRAPVIRGTYPLEYAARDVDFRGQFAYMVRDQGDLEIIDLTSPDFPVRGAMYAPSGVLSNGIDIEGSMAYVTCSISGLHVLDLAEPTAPHLLNIITGFYNQVDVIVQGYYAFVACRSKGLQVIDVSDPIFPVLSGPETTITGFDSGAADWEIHGSSIVMNVQGFHSYDISTPTAITHAAEIVMEIAAYRFDHEDGFIYAAEDNGLNILDATDPANLGHAARCAVADDRVNDVAVQQGFAYTAGLKGLQVFDVSNPYAPVHIGGCTTSTEAEVVEITGDLAYVGTQNTVLVIDIQTPAVPVVVGSCASGARVADLVYERGRLYVRTGYYYDSGEVSVFDVGDPAHPQRIGPSSTFTATAIDVRGRYAYTSPDGYRWFSTYDVSDPANFQLLGRYDALTEALDITVLGNRAFMAGQYGGFLTADLSNPAAPLVTGKYPTGGNAYSIDSDGTYIYGLDLWAGLFIFRTRDVWIQRVSPASGLNTAVTGTIAIAGANFEPGSTVKLVGDGVSDIPGVDVVVTSESITCRFDLAGAPVGPRSLVVTQPGNQSSALPDGFTVRDSLPALTGITPAECFNTGPVDVEIQGTLLVPGATVELSKAGEPDIQAVNEVVANASKINCSLDITGRAGGAWDVVVENGDGETVILPAAFTILVPSPPSPTAISPNRAVNTGPVNAAITGLGFIPGASVKLMMPGQSDIVATAVVTSPTQITCTFDLYRKPAGDWTLVVTNPGGLSGSIAKGFRLTDAMSSAKLLPNGEMIDIHGVVVTATLSGGYLYIESDDRTAGLLVYGATSAVAQGDRISVRGVMKTLTSGERYLQGNKTASLGTGEIAPIGMSVKSVAGGNWFYDPLTGAGQKGVTGGVGLNNLGLLVSVVGKVTFAGSNYFWVDDGSGIRIGAYRGVKVTANGITPPAVDTYVSVTGISSCYAQGSLTNRVIIARTQADVMPIQAP